LDHSGAFFKKSTGKPESFIEYFLIDRGIHSRMLEAAIPTVLRLDPCGLITGWARLGPFFMLNGQTGKEGYEV